MIKPLPMEPQTRLSDLLCVRAEPPDQAQEAPQMGQTQTAGGAGQPQ